MFPEICQRSPERGTQHHGIAEARAIQGIAGNCGQDVRNHVMSHNKQSTSSQEGSSHPSYVTLTDG